MRTSQGDVLLPLSTLKRTDVQSVLLNWTQSTVRLNDKQVSGARRFSGLVRGQATNNLPMVEHCKQKYFVWNNKMGTINKNFYTVGLLTDGIFI